MDPQEPLGGEEERAVLEELARLRETPPPGDPSSAGCVVAMVALVAFVFMPVATRAIPVGAEALLATGAALLLVAVIGTLVGVFGGRSARTRAAKSIEGTVEALAHASRSGDREAMRAPAVRLLMGATWPAGPVRVRAYDPAVAAARLGEALPYLLGVERLLLDRGEIEPVFTEPAANDVDGPPGSS